MKSSPHYFRERYATGPADTVGSVVERRLIAANSKENRLVSVSNESVSHELPASNGGGSSAVVELFLYVAGLKIIVSQVGGGKLYFQDEILLPAKHGTLVIEVDGQVTRREIKILGNDVPERLIRFV